MFDGIVLQISISTVHLKSLVHNLNQVFYISAVERDRETSKQLSVAKSFAIEQSWTVSGWFVSSARAAFLTIARAATRFVAILARVNWLC